MIFWWHRHDDVDEPAAQRQAQKALELSHLAKEVVEDQAAALDELMPRVDAKVSIISRINKENNFAARLHAAYAGKAGQ